MKIIAFLNATFNLNRLVGMQVNQSRFVWSNHQGPFWGLPRWKCPHPLL